MSKLLPVQFMARPQFIYTQTHICVCIFLSVWTSEFGRFLLEWPGSISSRLLKICEVDFQSIQHFMFSFTFSFFFFDPELYPGMNNLLYAGCLSGLSSADVESGRGRVCVWCILCLQFVFWERTIITVFCLEVLCCRNMLSRILGMLGDWWSSPSIRKLCF